MRCVVVFLCLLSSTVALAASPPLPKDQWNDEVALWLARAMVSEADWNRDDHAAMAWVLKKRWELRAARDPSWTFLDQLRAYCAGFRSPKGRSARQRWVRNLRADGAEPAGWPKNANWRVYRGMWLSVLKFSKDWGAGRVPDPCKGAIHWGGAMDRIKDPRMRPVDCGYTFNVFYALSLDNQ